MPIINRDRDADEASTDVSVVRIITPTAGASLRPEAVDAPPPPSDNPTKIVLISLLGLIAGVLLPFGMYFGMQRLGGEGPAETEMTQAASDNVDLDIQRLQKIAALVALTQKEYEMNTVSRAEAEFSAESMTLAALDAILDKERRELADAKTQMAQLLVSIHGAYRQSPRHVSARFQAAIDSLAKKDSAEVLRILQLGAKAVEAVPDDTPAATYFARALDNNL